MAGCVSSPTHCRTSAPRCERGTEPLGPVTETRKPPVIPACQRQALTVDADSLAEDDVIESARSAVPATT